MIRFLLPLVLGAHGAIAADICGVDDPTLIWSSCDGAVAEVLLLPEDAGGHILDVTDWMYLTENGAIMNRSEMRKFGVKVVELIATMRPAPAVKTNHLNGAHGRDATTEARPLQ